MTIYGVWPIAEQALLFWKTLDLQYIFLGTVVGISLKEKQESRVLQCLTTEIDRVGASIVLTSLIRSNLSCIFVDVG